MTTSTRRPEASGCGTDATQYSRPRRSRCARASSGGTTEDAPQRTARADLASATTTNFIRESSACRLRATRLGAALGTGDGALEVVLEDSDVRLTEEGMVPTRDPVNPATSGGKFTPRES